jgi:xylulokinase
MKSLILSHDLGTSGNKASIFSVEGEVLASEVHPYGTSYGRDNWAEQNPSDWWDAICITSRKLLERVDRSEIAVVCLSGQMMGCLCVDREGRPLRNSMIYSDQRATEEADQLIRLVGAENFYRIAGHRASASYSVEKLMWLKRNLPDVYSATYKMLNAKDFVNQKLTGRFCTDFNDASGTNCFDIGLLDWSDTILEAAGIQREKLPDTVGSTTVVGEVTAAAEKETGIPHGTPVVAGAGDGGCATVGAGCVAEGVTYNYLGSSSWISTASTAPINDDQMRTFTWVHPVPGLYQPCGTMQTAGSSVSWLAGEIMTGGGGEPRGPDAYERINREAESSPPGANGVIYLPYLLGERSPRWNPAAKGAWVGLKLSNKRADLVRAVLEGVAFNLEIILSILRKQLNISELSLIGGGALSAVWRQILADVFGVRVIVPRHVEEATSMGAAIIGGVGSGLFSFDEGAARFVKHDLVVDPDPERKRAYDDLKPVFDDCYRALEPTMARLE